MKKPRVRILALIPARSGSKGLRHKNIRKLHGVPLLARAVQLARRCRRRGEDWAVVVSTDSTAYARMARRAGAIVPFMRPRQLAQDATPLIAAVRHAVTTLLRQGARYDIVLLLSTTTPLTTMADVRRAIALHRRAGGAAVVSVVDENIPEHWRFVLRRGHLTARSDQAVGRRQTGAPEVHLNGAIYLASPHWLTRYGRFVVSKKTVGYVMPPERSLDIEAVHDLKIAAALLPKEV